MLRRVARSLAPARAARRWAPISTPLQQRARSTVAPDAGEPTGGEEPTGAPQLEPWSVDADVPIRLSPEMRPTGDTSRKYVRVDAAGRAYAVGRRKTASARVWVWEPPADEPASIRINTLDMSRFFGGHWHHREVLMSPFLVTGTAGKFSVEALVRGGGLSGQTEAMRLGIATAMQGLDLRLRPPLKKAGFLRRDPRRREPLKPGQPGARKKTPWVKR